MRVRLAALALRRVRTPLAEPGAVTKARPVAVTRPVTIAGALARQRGRWGRRALRGPPAGGHPIRKDGDAPIRFLALAFGLDAGLLLEGDVDDPALVVAGDDAGSKLTKAESLGVAILDERAFLIFIFWFGFVAEVEFIVDDS